MESIELRNFRCFEHLDVNFVPGVNLLIGYNASGKTSLLVACKFALSCLFSGLSDLYTKWATPGRVISRNRIPELNGIDTQIALMSDDDQD